MNYHNILKCDMVNGDGLRVVLFVSGCSNGCPGCHNKKTWDPKSGIPFDESAKNEVMYALSPDYISGITLSGGDPMFKDNVGDILQLIKDIRSRYGSSKNIWIYSGYTREYLESRDEESKEILRLADVLVDGRYMSELHERDLQYRGSKNQRIIKL